MVNWRCQGQNWPSSDVWRESHQRIVYLTWFTPGLRISTHPEDISAFAFLISLKLSIALGYNVLLEKLLDLSVHTYLIPWIISFLTNRRQSIELAGSTSDWLPIAAGVPQGTKLGQILFLVMINNLNIPDLESRTWKYVDDVSLSEGLLPPRLLYDLIYSEYFVEGALRLMI